MWKILYQLASPKSFYKLSERWIAYTFIISLILLGFGFIWAFVFSPPDYQQGDMVRLIYLHVPTAFLSLSIYFFMSFCALLFLVWRIKIAGIFLKKAVVIGSLMTFLALITGAIWGKPMWGTWWIWDARLTSELILFFIYLSIITLSYTYDGFAQREKVVAILTLVGLVDLPIIHYSVYWWNTLHQKSTLTLFAKPKIHISMLYPLLIILFGLGFYTISMILKAVRYEILWQERKQSWVRDLISTGDA